MKKNENQINIDCIEMKNTIQKQIYNDIKNMSANELLIYFNTKNKIKILKIPRKTKNKTSNSSDDAVV